MLNNKSPSNHEKSIDITVIGKLRNLKCLCPIAMNEIVNLSGYYLFQIYEQNTDFVFLFPGGQ